jgi:hypothetical protein
MKDIQTMTVYYYDDEGPGDHWRQREISPADNHAGAKTWGQFLFEQFKPKTAIVYYESDTPDGLPFMVVAEYPTTKTDLTDTKCHNDHRFGPN